MNKTINLLQHLLILTSPIVTIVIKDSKGTRDTFWKVTLHILGAELVPVARASPRSHTIQTLRLYSYSLHMYMKYWSVHQ